MSAQANSEQERVTMRRTPGASRLFTQMMPYLPDMRAKLKHATGHRSPTGTRPARIAQIYQYDPRRDDRENGARACRTICRTVACDSDATAVTPRGEAVSGSLQRMRQPARHRVRARHLVRQQTAGPRYLTEKEVERMLKAPSRSRAPSPPCRGCGRRGSLRAGVSA
jgi:hypothetical protein